MSILRGWHKPSDKHKYHYFENGESLCLKYAYEGEEFEDIRVEWVSTDIDEHTFDLKMDDRLCIRCQVYHEIGKCTPHQKYLKCDYCGRFGARLDHEEWNYTYETVNEVCLCKECGSWADNSE